MKKIAKVLAIGMVAVLLIALPSTFVSAAHMTGATYNWLIAAQPLCDLDPSACPVITKTRHGDFIEVTGMGTLSTWPNATIDGGGTFVHKDSAGNVLATGTWEADRLVGFRSWGDATPQGLPPEFEGGTALVQVTIHPDFGGTFTGFLRIVCTLGTFPPNAHEGITLMVPGGPINFNQEVSGFTLFVRTS